jgi:DNA-binding MarR family transcriptional regulator
MTGGRAAKDAPALIATQIEHIRRVLRQSISARAQSYPVTLTTPQLQALQVLVAHIRETGSGLSLSDLSARMGLAHSTVSGIVDRLERDGVLRRTTRPDDRRFTLIEFTDEAWQWIDQELPAARLSPLEMAVQRATSKELAAILSGLATLERLLTGDGP